MIETICTVDLPVAEKLEIKKNRLLPEKAKHSGKRISIVTGVHGDELEGQYVCYELIRRIEENKEQLNGIVDVYPSMNPLGMDSITRGIPFFDLDMNRIFPGSRDGAMTEYMAAKIVEDLLESEVVIDIHASNIYLTEIPQIRINELHKDRLVPLAEQLNVDFIWVHSNATVLESTLAYSLNSRGTDTLVVEMGVGMRTTKEYSYQIVDGIFHLMSELGIWTGEAPAVRKPMISDKEGQVCFLNAKTSGIFIPDMPVYAKVEKGSVIGRIVNPLTGELLDEIVSTVKGTLFTIRDFPVVNEGSLMGRILME